MPPVGFEPTISAGERPKTYALDRAATGTGLWKYCIYLLTGKNWINSIILEKPIWWRILEKENVNATGKIIIRLLCAFVVQRK